MSLDIERLNAALEGRYSIQHTLGEGGMAVVYLADDVRHERNVALKVLKPELAAIVGAERFLAEIKTTANLQHPHILPLHDSGEADGFLFFVMPWVEGESLRDRIDREKQLAVDEAIRITEKVAAALGHAHRQGIVHRDIKPDNILLNAEGEPVVADFGIALAVAHAGAGRVTETGLSVGTPHYMSPEQAAGDRDVDPRTDVYALGCVLYEMLTGEPPHQGGTAQAILARILTGEAPSARKARESVPGNVDATIRKALEKLPADRFTGAQEFATALADPGFRHGEAEDTVGMTFGAARGPWPYVATAVVFLAIGFVAGRLWLSQVVPGVDDGRPTRTVIPFPAGHVIQLPFGAFPFDLSDDGTRIAFVSVEEGRPRLYVRELATNEALALEGTDGARHPFFSPDGEWIGFFADSELKKASVDGRAVITVAEVEGISAGASWASDGTIVYSLPPGGLFRVLDTGGVPEPLEFQINQDTDESRVLQVPEVGSLRWPDHLPGGKRLLVSAAGGPLLVDLETFSAERILELGRQPAYVRGHIVVHLGEGQLTAVPFDLDRGRTTGPPLPVFETPYVGPGSGAALFRFDRHGSLVYIQGGFDRTLVLVDRNGRERVMTMERRGYRIPEFSPDGTEVLVSVDPSPSELWSVDVSRGTSEPLLRGEHTIMPVWHPDGRRFAVWHGRSTVLVDRTDLSITDSINPETRLWPVSWSADGRALFFNGASSRLALTDTDLYWMDPESDTVAHRLTEGPNRDENPKISPSGEWVAYASDRSGVDEIYVASWPEWEGHHRVSLTGGREPLWSRDGTELFFLSGNRIMAVDARHGFPAPDPVELFRGDWDLAQANNWDVNDPGDFVFVRGAPGAMRQFQYVTNWLQQLRTSAGSETGR